MYRLWDFFKERGGGDEKIQFGRIATELQQGFSSAVLAPYVYFQPEEGKKDQYTVTMRPFWQLKIDLSGGRKGSEFIPPSICDKVGGGYTLAALEAKYGRGKGETSEGEQNDQEAEPLTPAKREWAATVDWSSGTASGSQTPQPKVGAVRSPGKGSESAQRPSSLSPPPGLDRSWQSLRDTGRDAEAARRRSEVRGRPRGNEEDAGSQSRGRWRGGGAWWASFIMILKMLLIFLMVHEGASFPVEGACKGASELVLSPHVSFAEGLEYPEKPARRKKEKKVKPSKNRPIEHAITPLHSAEAKSISEKAQGRVQVGPFKGRDSLDRYRLELILDRMADGTKLSYGSQFAWWDLFCRAREVSPYRKVTDENFEKEESLFLDFVAYSTAENLWAPGTIKMRLAAIAARHVAYGYRNPLEDMTRVYMALQGFKKRYGTDERRRPVTPQMLYWLRKQLRPKERHDDAMIYFAVLIGFFFLLRASEYVVSQGFQPIASRGLRGCDIQARKNGVRVKWFKDADEIGLKVRGSKTDKFNQGDLKNHYRTQDPEFCVVEAAADVQAHVPHAFDDTNVDRIMKWQNGQYIDRSEVQVVLEKAAAACGTDPNLIGSHSLRFGGASAMYAAYGDTGMVQRWGRWASDAFQGYIWEARTNALNVAERMRTAEVNAGQ